MKVPIVAGLLPNVGPTQQTGKNEDEYDPIHDVDDTKWYEQTNIEGVSIHTAAAICRKRKHQL